MSLKPARFKLDEEVMLSGKPVRVLGYVQYEDPQAQLATRYLLGAQSGPPQIVEERAGKLSLLRPFPANASPTPSGNTVNVMGEKYTLAGVTRLTVLGAVGQPPGGMLKAPLVLSGSFNGSMGTLLREIAPGAPGPQVFYSAKPLDGAEIVSGEELAARQAAQQKVEEQAAAAQEEDEESKPGGKLKSIAASAVGFLIVSGLAYACTQQGEEGYSSGSRGGVSISVRRR
jgi:hypothetical protein